MNVRKNLFTNNNIPAKVNDWFLTDDECLQYCKKDETDERGGCFQFVQYVIFNETDYYIVTDTVDIYDFVGVHDEQAYEALISIIGSYGYGMNILQGDMDEKKWSETLLYEFRKENGKDWKRILAECIFEYFIFSADEIDTHLTMGQMYLAMSNFLQEN